MPLLKMGWFWKVIQQGQQHFYQTWMLCLQNPPPHTPPKIKMISVADFEIQHTTWCSGKKNKEEKENKNMAQGNNESYHK